MRSRIQLSFVFVILLLCGMLRPAFADGALGWYHSLATVVIVGLVIVGVIVLADGASPGAIGAGRAAALHDVDPHPGVPFVQNALLPEDARDWRSATCRAAPSSSRTTVTCCRRRSRFRYYL